MNLVEATGSGRAASPAERRGVLCVPTRPVGRPPRTPAVALGAAPVSYVVLTLSNPAKESAPVSLFKGRPSRQGHDGSMQSGAIGARRSGSRKSRPGRTPARRQRSSRWSAGAGRARDRGRANGSQAHWPARRRSHRAKRRPRCSSRPLGSRAPSRRSSSRDSFGGGDARSCRLTPSAGRTRAGHRLIGLSTVGCLCYAMASRRLGTRPPGYGDRRPARESASLPCRRLIGGVLFVTVGLVWVAASTCGACHTRRHPPGCPNTPRRGRGTVRSERAVSALLVGHITLAGVTVTFFVAVVAPYPYLACCWRSFMCSRSLTSALTVTAFVVIAVSGLVGPG